jgi:polyisoprenoid-binding protein YceI
VSPEATTPLHHKPGGNALRCRLIIIKGKNSETMKCTTKGIWCTRSVAPTIYVCVTLLLSACANPATNKPQARVATPAAETQVSAEAKAETLAITPSNSKIEFTGSSPREANHGSFTKFAGQIQLVGEKPENSRASVEIEMNSVETNEKKLTAHLQSADFFDVARFPRATFVSTEIKPGSEGGTHTITGNLDMHGVKKAITFPATITITGDTVAMQSEFAINRKDFGIVYPGPANNLIRDEVVLKLSVRASRAKG